MVVKKDEKKIERREEISYFSIQQERCCLIPFNFIRQTTDIVWVVSFSYIRQTPLD